MQELGRRQLRLVGPDRPVGVVQVEQWLGGREVDIGVPVGVDRSHVAPVGCDTRRTANAAPGERVRCGVAAAHRARHDVAGEVVAGRRFGQGARQFRDKVLRVEDIHPHARQRAVGATQRERRRGGLVHDVGDLPLPVDHHHAKSASLVA